MGEVNENGAQRALALDLEPMIHAGPGGCEEGFEIEGAETIAWLEARVGRRRALTRLKDAEDHPAARIKLAIKRPADGAGQVSQIRDGHREGEERAQRPDPPGCPLSLHDARAAMSRRNGSATGGPAQNAVGSPGSQVELPGFRRFGDVTRQETLATTARTNGAMPERARGVRVSSAIRSRLNAFFF